MTGELDRIISDLDAVIASIGRPLPPPLPPPPPPPPVRHACKSGRCGECDACLDEHADELARDYE